MEVHEARRRVFCQRRNLLVAGLRELGFEVPRVPEGAFYVYAGLPPELPDAMTFCQDLLESQGVAVTPGADFGDFRADRHVRFACATGTGRIETALARIGDALRDLRA